MREAIKVLQKLKALIWAQGSSRHLTFFEEQEENTYPIETGKTSLQYLINMNGFSTDSSLKRLHNFLHPALKFIQFCKHISENNEETNSNNEDFISMHEEELISSAIIILQIYCFYLSTAAPANISYFHFMREKDQYVHYNAIRYILEVGQISSFFRSSSKSFDIFRRLSSEARIIYIGYISHWTYYMVKYKCSAVYFSTSTMPYLILANMVLLCGLFDFENVNIFNEFKRDDEEEKHKIYEYSMFIFTYVLSQSQIHKNMETSQAYGYIQIALLGMSKLLQGMHKSKRGKMVKKEREKTMYAPSYWFAESIGFIKEPELETIYFMIILDLLANKEDKTLKHSEIKEHKLHRQKLYTSQDEEILTDRPFKLSGEETSSEINLPGKNYQPNQSSNLAIKEDHFNNLTRIIMYHCIKTILEELPDLGKVKKLQETLRIEIKTLPLDSFIRPYVLSIINFLHTNTFFTSQKKTVTSSQSIQNETNRQIKISPHLLDYFNKNQVNYSTEKYILSYETVGKNCSIFINSLYPKMLLDCNKQMKRNDGQIWGQILKHNTHEFIFNRI